MLKKPGLWLLLTAGLLIRLPAINWPIIGWRQADTAAMARNYYENGYSFAYPQVDWGGERGTYVETEFPVFSFIIAILFGMSGRVLDFYGRALSVSFYLIGAFYLYLLVRKRLNERTALWSCFFFLFLPLNIYFSRAFQPESAMLMCSIAAVYYFSNWINEDKGIHFLLAASFLALACLIKIPTFYLGLPLLYLSWLKFRAKIFSQYSLWLFALLALIPSALWYYHAHQVFLQSGSTFGIWQYGSDKWGNWNLVANSDFWSKLIVRIVSKHFAFFGFPIFLWGLLIHRETEGEKLFDFWLIAVVIYFLVVGKGNYTHSYYQLPFMIPATVFMAKVYSRRFPPSDFLKKIVLTIFLGGILATGAVQYVSMIERENPMTSEILRLAAMVKETVPESAPIIFLGSKDPTLLYLSHRKGWVVNPNEPEASLMDQEISDGARFIVGFDEVTGEKKLLSKMNALVSTDYEIVKEQTGSFIVKMKEEGILKYEFVDVPALPWKQGTVRIVSIAVENIGTRILRSDRSRGPFYSLVYSPPGGQRPCPAASNRWGVTGIPLPPGESIAPGQSRIFSFQVISPLIARTYSFRWQLQRELESGKTSLIGVPSPNLCIEVR